MARGRSFRRGGGAAKAKTQKNNPEVQVADVATGELGQETPEVIKSVEGARKGSSKGKKPLRIRKKAGFRKNAGGEPVTDFAGLIFMCNSETKADCFKHHVFGFPEAKKDVVERAKKGIKLFLFDTEKKFLHGVYKASSLGGMNLVSEAFQGSERKFPAQIRFRVHKDCEPLDESKFKPVIKENYLGRHKFRCELTLEQVGKLLQLFRPLDARGSPKTRPLKDRKDEPRQKGYSRREPAHKKYDASRGPRTGAYAGTSRSTKLWQPPSAGHYPRAFTREPLATHSQAGYFPGLVSNPDSMGLDANVLYRQRLDASDRRAYGLGSVLEGSMRHVGVPSDFARRRIPDDLYTVERSLPPPKEALFYDTLYPEVPYQREFVYGSRDDGRASYGNLPYKPPTTLAWGYP